MLPAGNLNRYVTLQQRVSGQDAAGQESTAWEDIDSTPSVWAWFKAPMGVAAAAEYVAGDREISQAAFSVRIRYREDLTAGMRLVEGSAAYDIRQVIPDIAGREFVDLVVLLVT